MDHRALRDAITLVAVGVAVAHAISPQLDIDADVLLTLDARIAGH